MSEISSTQPETAPATGAEQAKPNLTLQDLTMMVQVLQAGTTRGAWRADELSSIGGLYDRITAFLTAAGVAVKKNFGDAEEPKE